MWALKNLNLDWDVASSQRLNEFNELDEFHLKAYECPALYKGKMKRMRLFPSKLNSKWTKTFIVVQVFSHKAVELENKEGTRFKVNVQRIKVYLGQLEEVKDAIEEWDLDEV
ncbi:uncharacterized protein [Solanum tuberosum]|uniref:uncharacterized protein n=1 Tax=Solanum tuberosum TaxID=4113 RepID=UPI00073A41E0|nr:PREDICTED: uncharacterized protein LOC107063129 [Solanum tuberosum]